MHELSLAQSLMDVVAESAAREGIARVQRVTVVVGEWSAIVPDALIHCFEMLAVETGGLFDGASLVVTRKAAEGECKACGERFPAEVNGLRCPTCGGAARLITGTELSVDSYEGE